ncbi:head GIN domain-containing protein [soil metagenome]
MKSRLTLSAAALLAALIAALSVASPAARADQDTHTSWLQRVGFARITGSGKLATETRPIGPFQAILLRNSMKVVLRQGAREAVAVSADDNLLPLIETRVIDRAGVPTLEITTRPDASFRTRNEMVVTVDAVTLNAISISGSGEVVCDALEANELKLNLSGTGDMNLRKLAAESLVIRVSGSGDVNVAGRAPKASISIAGSGDVDTSALDADDVRVSIAGSCDATVVAHKILAVTIAGSGDVAYAGEAAVKTSIAGSGSVRKR